MLKKIKISIEFNFWIQSDLYNTSKKNSSSLFAWIFECQVSKKKLNISVQNGQIYMYVHTYTHTRACAQCIHFNYFNNISKNTEDTKNVSDENCMIWRGTNNDKINFSKKLIL